MSYLVSLTGATGFVGKNLRAYLKNQNIDTVDINRDELLFQNWNLSNTDTIVHLAGKAHDLKKTANSDEYYQVNLELTKGLYNSFLKSDTKKFIFISSVKASADKVDGVLKEDDIPNPQTDYGKSKLMAEQYIINQPLPDGKFYYILRPCMIHGPGNKGNLNLLHKFVQKGIPYPLAAFDNKRSFLSVENLCFVISLLLKNEVPSGVYQVSDDDALSTNEVVEILSNSLDRQPRLWPISRKVIKTLARIGDLFKLPLNTERLNKLTENYVVSNSKIKKALNAELPMSSQRGLAITAKSFGRINS